MPKTEKMYITEETIIGYEECAYCGYPFDFEEDGYTVEVKCSDGVIMEYDGMVFCSKQCLRDYYGDDEYITL